MKRNDWFRVEFERAKRRNSKTPKSARMVVCGPGLCIPTKRRFPKVRAALLAPTGGDRG